MTINFFKTTFLVIFLLLGYCLFYIQYEKLLNLNLNFKNEYSQIEDFKDINNTIDKISDNNTGSNVVLNKKNIENLVNQDNLDHQFLKLEVEVKKGDTFSSILKKINLEDRKIFEIISVLEDFYDPKKLKVNDKLIFYQNKEKIIKKFEISLDVDELLVVLIGDKIRVEEKKLEKILHKISHEFNITESLYTDGIKNNVPQNILIKLIKLFSFDLDFQRDIRKDTLVSISYDFNQIKENNKIEYQDLNYALISIDGKKLEYFKFLTNDGYIDYFNKEGKNVKKSILKTPLDGARISSSFGMRKHPISGYNKMHKGVDFAAPTGTPIYAGGNGVIEYIGRNGGYGKYIRIRHNNEYKTAYAHLSSYKKGISKGVRVSQGDIIGYVGSTGNSTGPHLHYEIIFQNKQINPLKLKLPSGKILKGEELKRFKKEYKKIYADHLNLLFE